MNILYRCFCGYLLSSWYRFLQWWWRVHDHSVRHIRWVPSTSMQCCTPPLFVCSTSVTSVPLHAVYALSYFQATVEEPCIMKRFQFWWLKLHSYICQISKFQVRNIAGHFFFKRHNAMGIRYNFNFKNVLLHSTIWKLICHNILRHKFHSGIAR